MANNSPPSLEGGGSKGSEVPAASSPEQKALSPAIDDPQKLLSGYDPKNEPYSVGQFIDCFDQSSWCVAQITAIDQQKINVHFEGWSKKYDETGLSITSQRLAPFRKRTLGYTGQKKSAYREMTYSKKDMLDLVDKMKDIMGKKFLMNSAAEVTDFIRGKLFFYVDSIITLTDFIKIPDSDLKEATIEFIDIVMEFILSYIRVFPEYIKDYENAIKYPFLYRVNIRAAVALCFDEMFELLKLFFGMVARANTQFSYGKYLGAKLDQELLSKLFPEIQTKDPNLYYAQMYWTLFKKKNGCQDIETVIKESAKNAYPLQFLGKLLQVFTYLFNNLKQDKDLASFLQRLCELLENRFASFTERDLNEINEVTSHQFFYWLNEIFTCAKPSKAKEIKERMELNLLINCIKSSSVIRKIQGFQLLKDNFEFEDIIKNNKLEIKKNYKGKIENIAKLFKEINFVDLLFNQYPHPEIIKMSHDIIRVLILYNNEISPFLPPDKCFFSQADVSNLIQCYQTKHEEMKMPLLGLFAEMAEYSPCWIINEVYMIIKSISAINYTEQIIEIIGSYIKNVIGNLERKKKPYQKMLKQITEENERKKKKGDISSISDIPKEIILDKWNILNYDILCNIIFNDFSKTNRRIKSSIKDIATRWFVDCLMENYENMKYYSDRCVKWICTDFTQENSYKYMDSMKLLMLINERLIKLEAKLLPFDTYCKNEKLFEFVIKNLCKYLIMTIKLRESNSDIKAVFGKSGALNIEFFPGIRHEDYLRASFEFLEYLVNETSGSFIFKEEYIQLLWDAFIINSASIEETNYLFLNFMKTKTATEKKVNYLFLSDSMALHLFKKYFLRKDEYNCFCSSKMALNCFKSFFLYYNIKEGNLEWLNHKIVITTDRQAGVTMLWNIAFLSTDSEVREEALKFIIELYSYFIPEMQSMIHRFTYSIVKWGYEFVQKDPTNTKKVMDAIKLIKEHINVVEGAKFEKIDKKFYFSEPNIEIECQIKEKDNSLTTIHKFNLNKNLNILHLRNAISNKLRIPKPRIVIKTKSGKKTLDEQRDRDSITEYEPFFQVELKSIDIPSDRMPSYVVANHELIQNFLMKYMQMGEEYAQEIWLLMKSFPPNLKKVQGLLEIGMLIVMNPSEAVKVWDGLIGLDSKAQKTNLYLLIYFLYLIGRILSYKIGLVEVPKNYLDLLIDKQGHLFLLHHYNDICESLTAKKIPSLSQCRAIHYLLKCFLPLLNRDITSNATLEEVNKEKFISNLCNNAINYIAIVYPFLDNLKSIAAKTISESISLIHSLGCISSDVIIPMLTAKNKIFSNILSDIYSKTKLDDYLLRLVNENILMLVMKRAPFMLEKNSASQAKPEENKSSKNETSSKESSKIPSTKEYLLYLLNILLQLLYLTEEEKKQTGENTKKKAFLSYSQLYFEVIKKLIEITTAEAINLPELLKNNYVQTLMSYLIEYQDFQQLNKRYIIEIIDAFYCKYRKQMLTIIPACESFVNILVDIVFPFNLSKYDESQAKLFKSNQIFDTALVKSTSDLIKNLALEHPQIISKIITLFGPLIKIPHWRTPDMSDWGLYMEDTEEKESSEKTTFVGLENPACLCYMNSVIQQLFMIPAFKKAILEVNLPQKQDAGVLTMFNNLAYQMKLIFSTLKERRKAVHSVSHLCTIIKDYDQRPLSIYEQRDADEFLNLFTDRLETSLKESNKPKLTQETFGGCFANEVICIDCPHKSINKEDFIALQLTVANKKSIFESLQGLIDGEALEGANAYSCDRCDKRVKAKRRASFKYLPNTLIVVLKRFEFDLQRNIKKKIYDYYEFPNEISFENYSLEYLSKKDILERKKNEAELTPEEMAIIKLEIPKEYYKYQLRGIVLHSGSAESGHYTSLAMDRENGNKWYEFNDRRVSEFNMEFLQSEAFGGLEDGKGSLALSEKKTSRKVKSAYMLVYERVTPFNMEKVKALCEDLLVAQDPIKVRQEWESAKLEKNYYLRIQLSNEMEAELQKDSDKQMQIKQVLDFKYLKLFNTLILKMPSIPAFRDYKLCKSIDLQSNISSSPDFLFPQLYQFFGSFILTVVLRIRIRNILPWILRAVIVQFNQDLRLSMWLLETFSHPEILSEFFISCPIAYKRFFIAGLVASCFERVYKEEKSKLEKLLLIEKKEGDAILEKILKRGEKTKDSSMIELKVISNHKIPFCLLFLNNFCLHLTQLMEKSPGHISQSAYLLDCLARTGPEVRKYLLRNNVLGILNEMLLGSRPYSAKPEYNFYITIPGKKYLLGFQVAKPNQTRVTVINLIDSYDVSGGRTTKKQRFLVDTYARLITDCLIRPLSAPPIKGLLPHKCNALQDSIIKKLTEEDSLKKLFACGKTAICCQAISRIILHLSKGDQVFSKYIIEKTLTWYTQSDFSSLYCPLFVLEHLLNSTQDDLQPERCITFMSILDQAYKITSLQKSYIPFSLLIDLMIRTALQVPCLRKILQQDKKKFRFIHKWLSTNNYPADGYVNWLETPKKKIEISRDVRPNDVKICKEYSKIRLNALESLEKVPQAGKGENIDIQYWILGSGNALFSVLDNIPDYVISESQKSSEEAFKMDIYVGGEWQEAKIAETAGGHILRFMYAIGGNSSESAPKEVWLKRGNHRIEKQMSKSGIARQFYDTIYFYANNSWEKQN